MKMRSLILLVGIGILFSSLSFAESQNKKKQFTGDDWLNLAEREKVETISSFIRSAKDRDIVIRKAPSFYSEKTDAFYEGHPDLIKEPVAMVLKTLMIMEYDWYIKGVDRETLARKWLGEELYKKNKARLAEAKR